MKLILIALLLTGCKAVYRELPVIDPLDCTKLCDDKGVASLSLTECTCRSEPRIPMGYRYPPDRPPEVTK